MTTNIIGYDTELLYRYYPGGVIPCGKDKFVVNEKEFDQNLIVKVPRGVLKGKIFKISIG